MEGDALRLRPELGYLALGDPAGQERRQGRRVEPFHRRAQGAGGERPVPARVEHPVQDVAARLRDLHGLGEQVAVVVDLHSPRAQGIGERVVLRLGPRHPDRKSTRLNSSHVRISYAVFCLKKKKKKKKPYSKKKKKKKKIQKK